MKVITGRRATTNGDRVAAEIRAELGRLGCSQAELARAIDEAPMWVSDRLKGTTKITVDDLYRIAAALGKDARDFLPRRSIEVTEPYLSSSESARISVAPEAFSRPLSTHPAGRHDPVGPGRPVRLTAPSVN